MFISLTTCLSKIIEIEIIAKMRMGWFLQFGIIACNAEHCIGHGNSRHNIPHWRKSGRGPVLG